MDSPTTILSIDLITSNPDVRGGRPVVRGTTIPVADIAIVKIYHRQDADGLAEWFGLSLPQVYAALAYYYEHREEIDADNNARRDNAEQMKKDLVGSRHAPLLTDDADSDDKIWEQKLAATQPQLDKLADRIRLQIEELKKQNRAGE